MSPRSNYNEATQLKPALVGFSCAYSTPLAAPFPRLHRALSDGGKLCWTARYTQGYALKFECKKLRVGLIVIPAFSFLCMQGKSAYQQFHAQILRSVKGPSQAFRAGAQCPCRYFNLTGWLTCFCSTAFLSSSRDT